MRSKRPSGGCFDVRLIWTIGFLLTGTLVFTHLNQPHTGAEPETETRPSPGLIWGVAAEKPVNRAALEQRLGSATMILLGEKHDNADHHRLQGDVLTDLVWTGADRFWFGRCCRAPSKAISTLLWFPGTMTQIHLPHGRLGNAWLG